MKQKHFIKNFKELNKNDTSSAGGKGTSLGEMTQARIPVPPGYVILADASYNPNVSKPPTTRP